LRGSAETFHLFRPQQAFRSVGLARGLRGLFAGVLRVHFRAPHPITEQSPSGFSAHRRISAPFARRGNPTTICGWERAGRATVWSRRFNRNTVQCPSFAAPKSPWRPRHRRLPFPAVSFIEGFRTPAAVQAASSRSAGIRNPHQSRPGRADGRSDHSDFPRLLPGVKRAVGAVSPVERNVRKCSKNRQTEAGCSNPVLPSSIEFQRSVQKHRLAIQRRRTSPLQRSLRKTKH
jgi:hypothetical protein